MNVEEVFFFIFFFYSFLFILVRSWIHSSLYDRPSLKKQLHDVSDA